MTINLTLLCYLILVVVAPGCTPKGPSDWELWLKKLRDSRTEKHAAPTITHHVYLNQDGDRAWLALNGAFPRLVKEACEKCPVSIQRLKGSVLELVDQDSGKKATIESDQTGPVFDRNGLFLSPQWYPAEKKMRVFVHDHNQEGLKAKRQRHFFSYAASFATEARFHWLPKPLEVIIQRSDGSKKPVSKVAELAFSLSGVDQKLSVYRFDEPESFLKQSSTMLLFRDYSNGKTTYGAGRFLNVDFVKTFAEIKEGDSIKIDLNFAYNPPCAVSTGFHCPLPQDTVTVAVEAGEKYLLK